MNYRKLYTHTNPSRPASLGRLAHFDLLPNLPASFMISSRNSSPRSTAIVESVSVESESEVAERGGRVDGTEASAAGVRGVDAAVSCPRSSLVEEKLASWGGVFAEGMRMRSSRATDASTGLVWARGAVASSVVRTGTVGRGAASSGKKQNQHESTLFSVKSNSPSVISTSLSADFSGSPAPSFSHSPSLSSSSRFSSRSIW